MKSAPRYEVRRNNDVYHIFDTKYYTAIDATRIEAEANAIVDELNEK